MAVVAFWPPKSLQRDCCGAGLANASKDFSPWPVLPSALPHSCSPDPNVTGAEDGPYLPCAGKCHLSFAPATQITECPTQKEGYGIREGLVEEKDLPWILLKAGWMVQEYATARDKQELP